MTRKLSPSILAADFSILGEQIKKVERAGSQYLHVDVMDGMFVPSISFGMPVLASVRKITNMVLDVHLMIEEPIRYIETIKKEGADLITVHLEACKDVKATLEKIREVGAKVGLSIKPGTPVEEIKPYLDMIDMLLVMTVEPGFGGQKYIEASTERIRQAKALIEQSGREIDIEVDGGISHKILEVVLEAGANVIVAGTPIFRDDIEENVKSYLGIMNQ